MYMYIKYIIDINGRRHSQHRSLACELLVHVQYMAIMMMMYITMKGLGRSLNIHHDVLQ